VGKHPLRPIRDIVDEALRNPSPAFGRLYTREGRPSIPPERLLRALLLQPFYTGTPRFCKNRDRLLNGDGAHKFMTAVRDPKAVLVGEISLRMAPPRS
jgi:hypothetical protein